MKSHSVAQSRASLQQKRAQTVEDGRENTRTSRNHGLLTSLEECHGLLKTAI
jgi:hypothetical protein